MKTFQKVICASALIIGLAAFTASAATDSFGITNYLNGATITSYPTNSMGTNTSAFGLPYSAATGKGLAVNGANVVGFCFRGLLINSTNTTGSISIQLVRSKSNTYPAYNLSATNAGNAVGVTNGIQSNDWETQQLPPPITITLTATTTNMINFQTNLDATIWGGDANNWIGIYTITPTFPVAGTAGSMVVTNTEAFLTRNGRFIRLDGFVP